MTKLEIAHGAKTAPWLIAAILATIMHAGAGWLILARSSIAAIDDGAGTLAIEIAIEPESVQAEDNDLPPGEISDASDASVAAPEQQTVDRPQDPDESVMPDGELASRPEFKPEKPEDKPQVSPSTAAPASDSAAAEARAPQAVEGARESRRTAAPTLGVGKDSTFAETAWKKQLVAYLDRHKRYPPSEMMGEVQVLVSFTLDSRGHVDAVRVVKSSGNLAFDDAAVSMLVRSNPVPKPPPALASGTMSFTLPVIFKGGNKARK